MRRNPIIQVADDGRDNLSLWERCRLIVEAGIRKYGDAGALPISGTGRARKKDIDRSKKPAKVMAPPNKNQHDNPTKGPADDAVPTRKRDRKRRPRSR